MLHSGKEKSNVVQLPEGVTPFIHITQNEFLRRKHKKLREEDIAICECKYNACDPESACGQRCLNVLTSIECTIGYCQCGENCRNQRFQKCEYAKTKLFRTEGRGWGLLADENIKAGQFIIECCGEVISSEEAKRRSQSYEAHELKDAYIISLEANYFIDSTRKGNFGRFINHSCQPNCETRKWKVSGETRLGIFAKQDIYVGTELTYNYNFEWYGGATVRCLCGAANCSIFLGAKSQRFQEYSHVWEDGDDRYMVEDVPLYDSAEDEPFLVISGTSGGNEHTRILNDSEGSMFKLEPSNSTCKNYNIGSGSTTKKKSQRPKLKFKSSIRKLVNDGDFSKMFASKEAREEVSKYEVQLPEGVTPFIHITQNEFLRRKHKKLREEDIAICECKYDACDPESACGQRCLNVLTSIECTIGYCQCGENCRNQRFQKCEYAKTKLFRTEGRGWGLLADENIKAGQFIIECCGEVISSEEAKRRSQAYEAYEHKDVYIISLDANYFIDATQKGNFARFINHSCQPNCETRKWKVSGETRLGIFAKQDIYVGTELTYNYNFEWYGGAIVRCLCGAANCSIFLGAKSQRFQEYSHVWEDGDDRYMVEDVPLYDSAEDEPFLVISGTSGGNEHTKILNDNEGSTFKLEPSNSTCKNYNIASGSTTKKKSQRIPKLKVKSSSSKQVNDGDLQKCLHQRKPKKLPSTRG